MPWINLARNPPVSRTRDSEAWTSLIASSRFDRTTDSWACRCSRCRKGLWRTSSARGAHMFLAEQSVLLEAREGREPPFGLGGPGTLDLCAGVMTSAPRVPAINEVEAGTLDILYAHDTVPVAGQGLLADP